MLSLSNSPKMHGAKQSFPGFGAEPQLLIFEEGMQHLKNSLKTAFKRVKIPLTREEGFSLKGCKGCKILLCLMYEKREKW